MISVVSKKTVALSKPVFIASIAGGIGCILLVGLLSSLVGRPNNCIKKLQSSYSCTVIVHSFLLKKNNKFQYCK